MLRTRLLPVVLVACLGPIAAGCGGGDGSATTEAKAPSSATTPTTPDRAADGAGATAGGKKAKGKGKGGSGTASPFADYVRDGRPATAATADAVRSSAATIAEAVTKRDAATVCANIAGTEDLLRANGLKGVSCVDAIKQLLSAGAGGGGALPRASRDQLQRAKVVAKGDRATIEINSQPLPMIRQDGRWKLNLGAVMEAAATGASAGGK